MKYNIFLFEDEKELCNEIKESISRDNIEVMAFDSWSAYKDSHISNPPHLAILDINLLDRDGLSIFHDLKERFPEIEGVVITGQGSMQNAIASLKLGIRDYIEKPFRASELYSAIESCESYRQFHVRKYVLERQLKESKEKIEAHWGVEFIGVSQSIKEIITLMKRVARSLIGSVLITGESGTGKELIARGIHSLSDRNNAPFYPVKCTAIHDSLFESEFFGYQKGVFAGALSNREGWFEVADGGTLFIDEIGDMNLSLQSKLLRVVDDKKVARIGSQDGINVNTRIISTTNKNMNQLIENGQFRLDLFHRLNTFHIHIPPLRERKDDIPVLVNHFVGLFAELHTKDIVSVHSKAMNLLLNHHYPGNIRELKNIIERAVLICDGNTIMPRHLSYTEKSELNEVDYEEFNLDVVERKTILRAMKEFSYNKTNIARKLNITRESLNRKLKKHGLE